MEGDGDDSCIQGFRPSAFFSALTLLVIICSIMYVAIVSYQVYSFAHKIEQDSCKYDFLARFQTIQERNQAGKQNSISSYMMRQGLLYNAALFAVWIFPLIFFVVAMMVYPKHPYVICLLFTIFNPMQGVFNCLIYLRKPKEILISRRSSSLDIIIPSRRRRKSIQKEINEEKQEIDLAETEMKDLCLNEDAP